MAGNLEIPFFENIQELKLKVDHQGNHACFINLDISVKNNIFVYNLFDKADRFPFIIVRMSYIDGKILQDIFYSKIKG